MKKGISLRRLSSWLFFLTTLIYLSFFTPMRIVSDKRALAYSVGFTIDDKRISLENGEILWVVEPGDAIQPYMRYVIFKGDFTGLDAKGYIEVLDKYRIHTGVLEFNESLPFAKKIASERALKDLVFRVHTVRQEEVEKLKLDEKMIYYRLRRAILERSIDLLWIQPLENIDTQEILKKIEKEFGKPTSLPIPQQSFPKTGLIPFLAILFGLASFKLITIFPALLILPFDFSIAVSVASITATVVLYFSIRKKQFLPLVYLLLGMLTYAALSDFSHMNDLSQFRGVKISLVALPMTLATISLLREWKWLKKYLPLVVVAGVIFGFYYISRSGNIAFVVDAERKLRDFIEGILWIRPRFKELVFYPVYFLSICLKKFKWSFAFEIIGSIALISTFNTFCHIKTPMIVSLYRSLFTIFFGYLTYFFMRRSKWF